MSNDNGKENLTELLHLAASGAPGARDDLYQLIYDDLRDAARRVLKGNSRGVFQTTALVNETLLKFESKEVLKKYSENRRVFFAVAIQAMRRLLIDHYRRRRREQVRTEDATTLDSVIASVEEQSGFDFERLTVALEELQATSPRQYAVISHRFFGGLSIQSTAEVLGISTGTVERDWRLARARLIRKLR